MALRFAQLTQTVRPCTHLCRPLINAISHRPLPVNLQLTRGLFYIWLFLFDCFSISIGDLHAPFTHCHKKEGFGKYAKYEKQAHPRLQFNKHFYGWKKYLVIFYNVGGFKMIKWGIIGYLAYRYWDYCWPVIKYGSIITIGTFVSLFLLRFGVYRKFGAATYEKSYVDNMSLTPWCSRVYQSFFTLKMTENI